MFSSKVVVPSDGSAIVIDDNGKLIVPDNPIVPFIRGDGIGADITPVMKKVVDAAVAKAYQGKKKIAWMEIYAGDDSILCTILVHEIVVGAGSHFAGKGST